MANTKREIWELGKESKADTLEEFVTEAAETLPVPPQVVRGQLAEFIYKPSGEEARKFQKVFGLSDIEDVICVLNGHIHNGRMVRHSGDASEAEIREANSQIAAAEFAINLLKRTQS
ncbi:hypothetical protein [Halostagnicola kamekurae]|uniref:Uncharacterized protein n=1 Tax=Halostagnicola kamekurae TaxID=619731 RepID=A0A1I6V5I0_9EURY|nr:hypothetical protein [Halostagnicola kamekurae]SFT09008.1 hypothetical protein SAMN04488556_0071 [Halostagnicola kamekurae]